MIRSMRAFLLVVFRRDSLLLWQLVRVSWIPQTFARSSRSVVWCVWQAWMLVCIGPRISHRKIMLICVTSCSDFSSALTAVASCLVFCAAVHGVQQSLMTVYRAVIKILVF